MRLSILLATVLMLSGTPWLLAQDDAPLSQDGIVVSPPNVYDSFYLQQRLDNLKAQLEGLQVVNAATLQSHIGSAQGGDLQQLGLSLQASGPTTPTVSTVTGATPSTTTTTSPLAPANPSVAASSLALPTPAQSSLDTLNESLQLAASITGTTLLLDGPINFKINPKTGVAKRTVTIGIPITFQSPNAATAKARENNVAEISVTLCSASHDVSIMTILPQERTYNVVGLVDHSVAASLGGVLGGVVSIGGGFLWHHQTYNLVQQQETVALRKNIGDCANGVSDASFMWRVYPVLGNKYVRPGMQENFVQLAIDGDTIPASGSDLLSACVRVAWRKSSKGGSIVDVTEAGPSTPKCYQVKYFDTTPTVKSVAVGNIGGSSLFVTAKGTFLPGTTVRVGSAKIPTPALSISPDDQVLKFSTSAGDLVKSGGAWLVSRDGIETPLVNPLGNVSAAVGLKIQSATVTPYSDTLDRLSMIYTPPSGSGLPLAPCAPLSGVSDNALCIPTDPWLVTVGDKVYGLADAPFFSSSRNADGTNEIDVVVPSSLLALTTKVSLQRLLWSQHYYYAEEYLSASLVSVAKATTASSAPGLHLTIVGSNLDKAILQYPKNCSQCLTVSSTSYAQLDIGETQGKNLKQVVLCRASGMTCDSKFAPIIIDVPKDPATSDKPTKFNLKPGASVLLGVTSVTIEGTSLDQIIRVRYGNTPIGYRLSPDEKPTIILDLPTAIFSHSGKYPLNFESADKSVSSYLLSVKPKPQ